jgi:hypothetical protein
MSTLKADNNPKPKPANPYCWHDSCHLQMHNTISKKTATVSSLGSCAANAPPTHVIHAMDMKGTPHISSCASYQQCTALPALPASRL